jgi:hypothetical protein
MRRGAHRCTSAPPILRRVHLSDPKVERDEREICMLLASLAVDDVGGRARVLCPHIPPARRFVVAMLIGRSLSGSSLSTIERADRLPAWCGGFGVSFDDVPVAVGVPG